MPVSPASSPAGACRPAELKPRPSLSSQGAQSAYFLGDQALFLSDSRHNGAGPRPAGTRASINGDPDALYQQGARAGKYLTRNVHEYPFEALLIAGAIGYEQVFDPYALA